MNRLGVLLVLLALVTGVARAADGDFWRQLTPEERRAAGIDQLSPDQQAALDQLARRYAREGARPTPEQVQQVRQEVREEGKREVKAEEKSKEVARAGLPADNKDVVVRSRATGKFNGWNGATIFRLQNGQTWVQSDASDRLWLPTMEDPEVEIRRSMLGGWKLYFAGKSYWVRVRRVQ